MKLARFGIEVLSRALNDDAGALVEVGNFMLYELGDLSSATVYLRRAFEKGAVDVAIDLAVAALFSASGQLMTAPGGL